MSYRDQYQSGMKWPHMNKEFFIQLGFLMLSTAIVGGCSGQLVDGPPKVQEIPFSQTLEIDGQKFLLDEFILLNHRNFSEVRAVTVVKSSERNFPLKCLELSYKILNEELSNEIRSAQISEINSRVESPSLEPNEYSFVWNLGSIKIENISEIISVKEC